MLSVKRAALTWNDVRVGLFIMSGLLITIIGIFFLQPGKRFGPHIKLRTYFSSVSGLIQGAPVRMAGVQIGSVTNIVFLYEPTEYPPNLSLLKDLTAIKEEMNRTDGSTETGRDRLQTLQRDFETKQSKLKQVYVLMEISSSQAKLIGKDSTAKIQTAGLVGDKYIDITISAPESPRLTPVRDSSGVAALEIPGEEAVDVNQILKNTQASVSSFKNVFKQLDQNLVEGHGTIAKLFKDPSVHDNLNKTLKESARATKYTGDLMATVKNGQGTLGKLFQDPAMYNDAQKAVAQMRSLMTKANQENGSLNKLLTDPSLYKNFNSFVEGGSGLIKNTNAGKGSLGKLVTDDAFYSNTSKAMANMAEISQKINKGEGTLGALVSDKKFYENMTAFSEEMVSFIKELRKNPKKYLTIQLNVIKLF